MKDSLQSRLLYAMNLKGFKAVDLCERLGIPKATMSYYMNGKQEPRSDRLHLIAKLLDVSEAWLIGYDVPMEREDAQRDRDNYESIVERLVNDQKFLETSSKLLRLNDNQLNLVSALIDQFLVDG